MYKIGVVAQKGGVGKSTLARAIAATYAAAQWNVKLADLDVNQSTSFAWSQRRLQNEIEPFVLVECFGTVGQVLRSIGAHDLVVFDGAPHASRATVQIAEASDLLILPTGLSLDDLEPTVMLANALAEEHGLDPKRISFALCRTGTSPRELEEARAYLAQTPYHTLKGAMQEKTAFRRAQDAGLAAIETPYRGPRAQVDELVQSAINRLEYLTRKSKKK